jgi:hypothetical protein
MLRKFADCNLPLVIIGGTFYMGWLMVVYVLTAGPIVALASQASAESKKFVRPVEKLYAPVGWLHGHTPLKHPLEAYAQLWGLKKKR